MSRSESRSSDTSRKRGTGTGRSELDYLRNGRSQALDRFSKNYAASILGWAIRLGHPGIDPQEIAREVYIAVLGGLENQPDKLPAKAWIYRLTRSAVITQSKRTQRKASWLPWKKAPPSRSKSQGKEEHEKRRAIQRVLQELSFSEREALVLVDMEDFSLAEAGIMMGRRPTDVGQTLQTARKKFARESKRQGLEPPTRKRTRR